MVNVLISFYMNHNCNNAASHGMGSSSAAGYSHLPIQLSTCRVQFTETTV